VSRCVWQVDWGLALPWLDKRNAAGCGTATFTANGFFNATTKAPHPIMDIASVAYTWLAIVHGNPYGEPPWNDEDSRTGWLSAKRRAKKRWLGVAEVDEFLGRVYSLAGARSMPPLMGLYEWCVEVSLDAGPAAKEVFEWMPSWAHVVPQFACLT
jgi:hypothetical protein